MATTTYNDDDTFTGQACIDCLMFIANGEAPLTDPATGEDMTEADESAWVDSFCEQNEGIHWTIGDDDDAHFSWSPCGVCGSTLGGDRMAVVGWAC